MSDNTLNKALLIMSCDCPRRRLLRARFPLDRVDPAKRGERVRRQCNESPIRPLRGDESVSGATRWCGACLATATRSIYNHAAYWAERVRLTQHWSDGLDSLRDGAPAVSLHLSERLEGSKWKALARAGCWPP
jgi:hypothetical protein